MRTGWRPFAFPSVMQIPMIHRHLFFHFQAKRSCQPGAWGGAEAEGGNPHECFCLRRKKCVHQVAHDVRMDGKGARQEGRAGSAEPSAVGRGSPPPPSPRLRLGDHEGLSEATTAAWPGLGRGRPWAPPGSCTAALRLARPQEEAVSDMGRAPSLTRTQMCADSRVVSSEPTVQRGAPGKGQPWGEAADHWLGEQP